MLDVTPGQVALPLWLSSQHVQELGAPKDEEVDGRAVVCRASGALVMHWAGGGGHETWAASNRFSGMANLTGYAISPVTLCL